MWYLIIGMIGFIAGVITSVRMFMHWNDVSPIENDCVKMGEKIKEFFAKPPPKEDNQKK